MGATEAPAVAALGQIPLSRAVTPSKQSHKSHHAVATYRKARDGVVCVGA